MQVMPRTPRSAALRAWFTRYVNAPRYGKAATNLELHTDDGVQLHAVRLAGPAPSRTTVVVAHGFANWHRHPPLHRFVTRLAAHTTVIVVDLRGHGLSRGVSSVGACEWMDVAAAVREVDEHDSLVLLGTSMGAGAAVTYAGLAARDGAMRPADAVVAISGPARWGRVLDLNDSLLTRVVLRLMRVRIGRRQSLPRIDPVTVAEHIAPAPVLLVHDKADWYFGPGHPEALAHTIGRSAQIWWRTGGHATDLLTDELLEELVDAFAQFGVLASESSA